MYWNESGNDPRSWITRIISFFISLFAVQNTSHFTYSCHFYHRVYHQLTMACPPVGLFSPMDRAWRPVIVKVRVFQVLFQPPTIGCLFNFEDHFHFHMFIHSLKYEQSFHIFTFTLWWWLSSVWTKFSGMSLQWNPGGGNSAYKGGTDARRLA